jgi:hypothetical protein
VTGICQVERTMVDSRFIDSCLRDLTGSWSKLVTGETSFLLIVCTRVSDIPSIIPRTMESQQNFNTSNSNAGKPLESPGGGISAEFRSSRGRVCGHEDEATLSLADLRKGSVPLGYPNELNYSSQLGANDFSRAPGEPLLNRRGRGILSTSMSGTGSREQERYGMGRQSDKLPNALQLGLGLIQHPQTPDYPTAITYNIPRSGSGEVTIQPSSGLQSHQVGHNHGAFTAPSSSLIMKNELTKDMASRQGMQSMQTNSFFGPSPSQTVDVQLPSWLQSNPRNSNGGFDRSPTASSESTLKMQSIDNYGAPPPSAADQPNANDYYKTSASPHYGNGLDAYSANLNPPSWLPISVPPGQLNSRRPDSHQPVGQSLITSYGNTSSYNAPLHLQPNIPVLNGGSRPFVPSHVHYSITPVNQNSPGGEAFEDFTKGVYYPDFQSVN